MKIAGLLADFEKAEAALRSHPSAPHWSDNPNPEYQAAMAAWESSYQRTFNHLGECRTNVVQRAVDLMQALHLPDAYNSICELAYFNTWMLLRQDKRWGDSSNAAFLATSLLVVQPKDKTEG